MTLKRRHLASKDHGLFKQQLTPFGRGQNSVH